MRRLKVITAVGTAAFVLALAPRDAQACGGFFCGQQPVDQTAERIVFAVNGDGTTTMITQITYRGDAENFAWILPLAQVPAVESLGTFPQRALVALDARTGPQFQMPSDCRGWLYEANASAGPPTAGGGEVTVHIRAEVGPYDVAVVESRDPIALVDWLRTNDFRVTSPMEPYIRTYTDEGMKFLALKLRRGQDVTDIQPFKLTLQGETPSIPIRLTALAAEPEMGITVFVLGDRRYGPANWPEVEVNDADIVWRPYTWPTETNWTALVARSVDDAGGHGFVTEMAGTTTEMAALVRDTMTSDPEQLAARDALLPLLEDNPYITRLYTRLSPEEMTLDPVFRRTAGGDVSPLRMLPRIVHGEDVCADPSMPPGGPMDFGSACDFAACGAGGLCREVADSTAPGGRIAGCACAPGTTARATRDPSGRATVTCQDLRMSFLNPGDREVPGALPLPDPCVGFSCGAGGHCTAMNLTPTCVCDEGLVAIGDFDDLGVRSTRCVTPTEGVPPSFYDWRPMPLPASLPGGRVVDLPPVPVRTIGGGGGLCSAASEGASGGASSFIVVLGALALVAVRRRRQ